MHILVTADTVGGVWTYTRELVTTLSLRGIRVTLVSFGGIPTPAQTAWLDELSGVTYYPTAFRLEWMQDSARDIIDSMQYLRAIIDERKPDVLHLSQYCYGAIPVRIPKLVVAHSDVLSWGHTVRGTSPQDSWSRWYRDVVSQGLHGASTVIAPSRWMLSALESSFGPQHHARVIYNGRTPTLFNPHVTKHNYAASVGRLWDEAKQSHLLLKLQESPVPVFLAGAESLAGDTDGDFSGSVNHSVHAVQSRGILSESEIRQLLSRASIYIATSKYEPFGLAPLEAALSRCALVASDIPSFREIWGDTAVYFRPGDVNSLHDALKILQSDQHLRLTFANRAYHFACERYSAKRMVDSYLQLYYSLLERRVTAA